MVNIYICYHPYRKNNHLESFPIFKYIIPGKNETDCIL